MGCKPGERELLGSNLLPLPRRQGFAAERHQHARAHAVADGGAGVDETWEVLPQDGVHLTCDVRNFFRWPTKTVKNCWFLGGSSVSQDGPRKHSEEFKWLSGNHITGCSISFFRWPTETVRNFEWFSGINEIVNKT